ncbi:uncharacterized protein ACIB01_016498 [Guaruba guarouba]
MQLSTIEVLTQCPLSRAGKSTGRVKKRKVLGLDQDDLIGKGKVKSRTGSLLSPGGRALPVPYYPPCPSPAYAAKGPRRVCWGRSEEAGRAGSGPRSSPLRLSHDGGRAGPVAAGLSRGLGAVRQVFGHFQESQHSLRLQLKRKAVTPNVEGREPPSVGTPHSSCAQQPSLQYTPSLLRPRHWGPIRGGSVGGGQRRRRCPGQGPRRLGGHERARARLCSAPLRSPHNGARAEAVAAGHGLGLEAGRGVGAVQAGGDRRRAASARGLRAPLLPRNRLHLRGLRNSVIPSGPRRQTRVGVHYQL